MGAAISDYPEVDELVNYIRSKDMRYSCASLRADSFDASRCRWTWQIVGKRRLPLRQKRAVNDCGASSIRALAKSILQNAATLSAKSGIQHMRLYIMIGLPTETDEDIEAIVGLAERTQAHMAEVGCKGRLTLSINPFIPKPLHHSNGWLWINQKTVEKKLQYIKKALQKNRRIEVLVESPKEAYIQGVSRLVVIAVLALFLRHVQQIVAVSPSRLK